MSLLKVRPRIQLYADRRVICRAHVPPGLVRESVRHAAFSKCLRYRYQLSCTWRTDLLSVNFLMLNPSTATERENDPTVERCGRRAAALGFGAFNITNLFAFRATDPKKMMAEDEPIGELNDEMIIDAARSSNVTICAWGRNGSHLERAKNVLRLLRLYGIKTYAFKLTNNVPHHPLYLPYELKPRLWTEHGLGDPLDGVKNVSTN